MLRIIKVIMIVIMIMIVISDSSHLFSKRSPCRESVELELVGLQVQQGLVEDLDLHQQQLVLPGRLPVAHNDGPLPHHGTVGAPEEGRGLDVSLSCDVSKR